MSAADESLLDLSLLCLPFEFKNITVTAVSQRYLDRAPGGNDVNLGASGGGRNQIERTTKKGHILGFLAIIQNKNILNH